MKILVGIGHPAHFHYSKFVIKELQSQGHQVIIATRDVPIIKRLLEAEGISYYNLGKKGKGIYAKLFRQLGVYLKLLWIVWSKGINVGIGSPMFISPISKLSRIKSINMDDDDDEVSKFASFSHPFSDAILTPEAIRGHRKGNNAIFYAGCHELAYLHPNWFTPDELVLKKAGLHRAEKFFILRFVAFQAYHDGGHYGISIDQKRRIIKLLSQYGRVIITSEHEIEPEFEQYRLPVPPEEILSLMYYATMFIGDSQTMTSEAAIMGVPALKCNTFAGKLSVPNELEQKYGLCYAYHPDSFEQFYEHIERLLKQPDLKKIWMEKREKFLSDKIDVSSFFTWFIENYPESKKVMTENPDYQYNFR